MKILGIVPARGGSKRLPRKNIADLGGKPLIAWTLEEAKKSQIFDKVIVSTEDQEIGQIADAIWGGDGCWWHRNPILALDTTPSAAVVAEVFNVFSDANIVVLLQPTSPFRAAGDIIAAIDLLISTKGDSVISVTAAPQDLAFEIGFTQRLRDVPNIVVPNGAIYAITGEALSRGESWYSGITYGYVMDKERSLDIDNGQDLEIARMLVEKGMLRAAS